MRRELPRLLRRLPMMGSRDHEPTHPEVRENARLTAVTGLLLLVPLLVVVGSGLLFGQFWRVHYFVAFLIVPLVVLKLASTGYRAVRYYLGTARYRTAGPPAPLLRLLAPALVLSTLLLFVTGIVMWAEHSTAKPWSTLHGAAAVVFCSVLAIHLLAYLPRAWRTARPPRPSRADTADRSRRWRGAAVGAVVFGLVLAVATIPSSQQPKHGAHHFHGDIVGVAPPPAVTAP